ncbi:hypothetical protein VTN96DRAFT_8901 [Rasamsonia emersonii]|uniref:Yeast cell wall synthesis Kre9/Knh1-like N-terminal domain-containing protein n=1 Tax=Rasamsonia emersonii (strain ATCC 16479 / CBS 393.64 / IMI 116815) TaxID=1408163 RepID=A0A0F4Z2P7_RASE3|nr:hypothetical protein T310_1158 [Rasamsonia emersonii CBS 393.64]KKA24799.1 hypothetical protein T310_1158 [Rasamsonia emersonii CBS 393.64]
MSLIAIFVIICLISLAQGIWITFPNAGSIIDAQQPLALTWTYDTEIDTNRVYIYIVQNSTQFAREMAINVDVPAQTYTLTSWQDIIPNGDGYQISFVPMQSGTGNGALSEKFSVVHSIFSVTSFLPGSTSSTSAATSAAASTAFPSHVSRSSDTNGLTPGSKAGISLGTIGSVALVGTLSGLVFLYYRKYKRKRSRADRWLPEPPQQKQAAEVHPVVEMDEGTRKHELDGNTACLRPELSASGSVEKRRIHELPG